MVHAHSLTPLVGLQIHTLASLLHSPGRTCFRELHLGLDFTRVQRLEALDAAPEVLPGTDFSFLSFGRFLRAAASRSQFVTEDDRLRPCRATFARNSVGGIANEAAVLRLVSSLSMGLEKGERGRCGDAAHPTPLDAVAVDFGSLSLEALVDVMSSTTIFVAAMGTGLHNVVFMQVRSLCMYSCAHLTNALQTCQPGSVVVVIMQPGWCDWHWKFSSQAVAAGMFVVVVCHPGPMTGLQVARLRWNSMYGFEVRPLLHSLSVAQIMVCFCWYVPHRARWIPRH